MAEAPLPPQVLEALKAGNKIEAIKQLRAITGLGLKEAKDWIESYERGGSPPPPTPFDGPSEGDRNKPINLSQAAMEAMKRGSLIEAIKDIRASTGVGLAEGKAIAEMIQKEMPQPGSVKDHLYDVARAANRAKDAAGTGAAAGLAPGQVASGAGSGKWLALAAVVIVVIAAAFFY